MNIKKEIGPFVYDDSKTTMEYGYHYRGLLSLPFDEERFVRIWLPEDYDFNNSEKRFPVIYFSDGQNLVNEYLTAFGDWKLDKVAHKLLINENISFIAVGIDSPSDWKKRANELNPPIIPDKTEDIKNPKGDLFIKYIVNDLKPLIDKLFFTLGDKNNTAIGGSSMGGIMAFYGGVIESDTFGFSLDFSPAFFLYSKKKWISVLDSLNIEEKKESKFFLYVGGKKFERLFKRLTFYTYRYMLEKGIDSDNIGFIYDKKMIHHESAWATYLYDAIYFWLKND